MKKLLVSSIGFFLLAGFTLIERPNPVMINGHPFANALTINGVIAISVEDLARAISGNINLQQSGLQLSGNRLMLVPAVQKSAAPNTIGGTLGNAGGHSSGKVAVHDISITKRADVSSAVFMHQGKAYVPLSDVAKAFGGTFSLNGGTLRPGQTISLNFARNANAALVSSY